MKKCETDAAKACDVSAKEKKLAGAQKKSFEKKCVLDAVGPVRKTLPECGAVLSWRLPICLCAFVLRLFLHREPCLRRKT